MQTLRDTRSVFNPTDSAMNAAEGQGSQNMSVIEVLNKVGIDPQGPATQLRDFFMSQMKNADPLNKMRALAGGGQARPPMQGQGASMRPQAPPQGGIGNQFDKLFNQ